MKRVLCIPALLILHGCGQDNPKAAAAKPPAAARVSNSGIQEKDLATVRLTARAAERLGISTVQASLGKMPGERVYPGEVVLPPGQVYVVTAPAGGTILSASFEIGRAVRKGETLFTLRPFLAPERNLQGQAKADLDAAKARLDAAQIRLRRAQKMLEDGAGSRRAVDDANGEMLASKAAVDAAQGKLDAILKAALDADVSIAVRAPADGFLRQVTAQSGQSVTGGAAVCEIADWSRLWVKALVFSGELASVRRDAGARVRRPASGAVEITLPPVAAPPTADPNAATVDLYYALDSGSGAFRPGERLEVRLESENTRTRVQVPSEAIVYDIHGGAWVYEEVGPQAYARRRVEVERIAGGRAYIARGLQTGARIVTTGAAELFGTEFGAGK
ncbi:MAG: efflux RND transporter periplasmic adaptor subunit [Acidobacteria bacterium]|nr:efflux RND transporter periplasmic adaptor subunit [Acidobacteriota bacterium]